MARASMLLAISAAIGCFAPAGDEPAGGAPNPTNATSSITETHPDGSTSASSSGTATFPVVAHTSSGVARELMSLDPREDGWVSEHFNSLAATQLGNLAKLIEQPASMNVGGLAPLLADEFACAPLRPGSFSSITSHGPFQVHRAEAWDAAHVHRGAEGLMTALREMLGPLGEVEHLHAKFKVIRVQLKSARVTTVQLVEVSGPSADGMIESHATWHIDWQWGGPDAVPRVRAITAEAFHETAYRGGGPLFSDCTRAVFAGERNLFEGQLMVGIDRWVRRIEAYHDVNQFGYNGIAIGDVNGDGLDDVYVCQTGGLPNQLLLAAEDGTVVENAAAARVDFLDNTRAALLIDLDNDGDQDLVLTLPRTILFLNNDGQGRFTAAARTAGIRDAFSLAAADFDNDSFLDVYACVYYAPQANVSDIPVPTPLYDANNGGRNVLLKNGGNWQFHDVTGEVGLDENNSRFTFAAVWEDYDNDGDQDLFVANDFGRNNLYRNDGGRFRDVTEEVGMDDGAFGMSAAAADYNRDGWVDFYKANMFSSAGNRVTHQERFMPDATEAYKDRHRHLARGNTLFENRGGQEFRDVSTQAGVTMGRWSWGSLFLDYNNDGWEDLFVANGFMTGLQLDDL
jgi:hypothetical protein